MFVSQKQKAGIITNHAVLFSYEDYKASYLKLLKPHIL